MQLPRRSVSVIRAKTGIARATLFAVALLSLLSFAVACRADISVRANINPQRAQPGEWLSLTIEVSGTQSAAAPSIQIPGFDVRYRGPSTQVSIVNGQMNASVQHIYLLSAQRAGRYTLGPFTVEVGGQQYSTAPLNIEITPPGQTGAAPEANTALRLSLSLPRNDVYLHERIPVDITLYVGSVRAGDVQYPSIAGEGFSLDKFNEPTQRQEVIDGQTFQVLRFETILTPLRTGALALGPATLTLNVFDRRRGSIFDDPFFTERHPTTLHSEPVTLNVLPLPEEGKPASFTGAVGHFTLDVSAGPGEVNVGDPVTVRMSVAGSGNLGDVQPPLLATRQGFKVYDARAAQSDSNTRVFEQVLIPNDTAVKAVPPVHFSFFDPEQHRYETLTSQPIALSVHPAQQPQRAEVVPGAGNLRQAPEELGRDIVYIKDDAGRLRPRGAGRSVLFWLWQPLPLLVAIGALWFERRRARLTGDVRYARFTRAGKKARQGLQQAAEALRNNAAQSFYDNVANTIRDYLAAKLDLPPGAVDTQIVETRVPQEVAQQVRQLLETCEQMRFAPVASNGDMRGVLQLAEDIVRRLDRDKRLARSLTVILLSAAMAAAAHASEPPTNPQTTFFKANGLYGEGKYADAASTYEQIVQAGLESAPLYFNLGNAYFKLGHKGDAVLNYERALRLAPGDPDVQANLAYARSLTHAETCETPLWARLAFPLASRLDSGRILLLATVFYTCACLCFAAGRLLIGQRRMWQYAAAASVLLCVIAVSSYAYAELSDNPDRHAVVTANGGTPARFQPSTSGTEHFALPEGAAVSIVEQREGWSEVRRCDGRRGWVAATALQRLSLQQ